MLYRHLKGSALLCRHESSWDWFLVEDTLISIASSILMSINLVVYFISEAIDGLFGFGEK